MGRLCISILLLVLASGCATHFIQPVEPGLAPIMPAEAPSFTAVGYGVESNYKNYPLPRQRLLAIRAAKLDAYRNLAEEINGTRLRGHTSVKDAVVESDSYRAYVDAIVRGAHLISVTPKGEGVYEAEVELRLSTLTYSCLMRPAYQCLRTLPVAPVYAAPLRAPSGCVSSACNTAAYPIVQSGCATTTCGATVYPAAYPAVVSNGCGSTSCFGASVPQVYYYSD
jgi:hypothetical protein